MLDELKQLGEIDFVDSAEEEMIQISDTPIEEVTEEVPTEEIPETTEETEELIEIDDSTEEVTEETETIEIEETVEEPEQETEGNLTAYARLLNSQGILSEFNEEEFDKLSVEDQADFFVKQKEDEKFEAAEELLKGYIDELHPDMKWMLENYKEGVSWETILEAKNIDSKYGELSEEELLDDEDAMKDMIIDYQIQNGVDEDIAKTAVAGLADLTEMSKKVYPKMKALKDNKIEEAKKQAEQTRVQQEEYNKKIITQYSDYIDGMDEVIPGVKIPQNMRKQVKEYITKPVKIVDGRPVYYADELRSKDPVKFNTAINYLLTVTDGLTDFSAITNKAASTATKKIVSDVLSREANKKSKKTNIASNKQSAVLEALKNKQFLK